MKRVLIVAAVLAIAIPAFASSELTMNRVTGVNQASYNMATGALAPAIGERNTTDILWEAAEDSGWYFGSMAYDWLYLDGGGYGDPNDPALIQGFAFGYATDLILPTTVNAEIIFFGDYQAFNNNGFYGTYGFIVNGLPTGDGSTFNGWTITIDLEADPNDPNSVDLSFPLIGNDIGNVYAQDGMADFGYSYWFPNIAGTASATGPFLASLDLVTYGPTKADAEAALGTHDVFDAFTPDAADPNNFLYVATYWFGGWDPNDPNTAYAQSFLVLYGGAGGGCPNPGASGSYCTADIDGDCIVDLADLAALLAVYNQTGANLPGDFDNSGAVDLADLAFLLAQYNDNCQ